MVSRRKNDHCQGIRITHELEFLLDEAAQALGISQSEFIHEAIVEKCRKVLRPRLSEGLAPFIGRIKSNGGRARKTGIAFKRALLENKAK